ncbi:caspase family protein [Paenibacillus nasutitermitis]|uniref:Peptidase C14A caspase catalytic domain-containing protein n=1 Tax=Paenibacillus nasutitermitis TaxID=1652958 RepID=A0A916ZIR9_9BACL|nr:caspase family protein [Paenibacillus nasutitermitis]GGE00054.1 hypothetical protein GCM10010911_68760 [Paenibacillus nasutitermitis]
MGRLAYIIGINKYLNWQPLHCSVNDAIYMQEVLKSCDFETELLLDSNKETLREALASFCWRLREYDTGLLFFAGHGVELEGRQYIVPSDCVSLGDDALLDSLVDTTELILNFSSCDDFTGLVLLDCCRKRVQRHFLSRGETSPARDIFKSRGVYIAFATGPDGASHESGNHGIFTSSMGKMIEKQGDEKIEDIFKAVRREVMKEHRDQIPWDYSSMLGDFYFKGRQEFLEIEVVVESQAELDSKLNKIIERNLCYSQLVSEIENWYYSDFDKGLVKEKSKEQFIQIILQKIDELTLERSGEVTIS